MARRSTSGPKKVDLIRHDDRRTNFPRRRCRASSNAKKITVHARQRPMSVPVRLRLVRCAPETKTAIRRSSGMV